jgi:glutaredoxin 3
LKNHADRRDLHDPLLPLFQRRQVKRKGVTYSEIDVSRDWERRNEMIQRTSGRMTVPQIFIGPVHVGGSDELHALERAGKLDPLLADDGASL